MTRVGIFVFTYGSDEDICRKSLKFLDERIQKIEDAEFHVFVVDDLNNSWKSYEDLPSYCKVFFTNFERNGNLNGNEFICGMLRTIDYLKGYVDLDYIIKMDSDVLLVDPLFMKGCDYVGSSSRPNEEWYGWGNCYGMSSEAFDKTFQLAINVSAFGTLKEDVIVGSYCRSAMGGKNFLLKEVNNGGISYGFESNLPVHQMGYAVLLRPGNNFVGFPEIDENTLILNIEKVREKLNEC